MALPTTNITTTSVKNTLGEDSNAVSHLATSPNINKWSKSKPQSSTNYTYGLDLSNNWSYATPTSNYTLGSFRGYNHTALPTFKLNAPSSSQLNVQNLGFTLECNESDITVEDLLLADWYLAVTVNSTWYYAQHQLKDRATQIDAVSLTVTCGEGNYNWSAYLVQFPDSLEGIHLPEYSGYVISGTTSITLQDPEVITDNRLQEYGLVIHFFIVGSYVKFSCLGGFSGVVNFYENGSVVDTYVFSGSEETNIITGITPPIGWGSSKTIVVDW